MRFRSVVDLLKLEYMLSDASDIASLTDKSCVALLPHRHASEGEHAEAYADLEPLALALYFLGRRRSWRTDSSCIAASLLSCGACLQAQFIIRMPYFLF